MDGFIGLLILGVGGFIAWKILVAFLIGLRQAGDSIVHNTPDFFSKVIQSIAAGAIGGIIVAIVAGADSGFVGPSALGFTAAAFIKEQFFA